MGTSSRITISLNVDEAVALASLATSERRDFRAQAALLVRNELERLGYLEKATPSAAKDLAELAVDGAVDRQPLEVNNEDEL